MIFKRLWLPLFLAALFYAWLGFAIFSCGKSKNAAGMPRPRNMVTR